MKNYIGLLTMAFLFVGCSSFLTRTGCIDGNCLNGHGTYIWDNGYKHVGSWNDGLLHGHGTQYFPNGDKRTGEWRYGKKHGESTYVFADGERNKDYWINGREVNSSAYRQYAQNKSSSSGTCYGGAAQSAFGMITAFANALSGNKGGVAQGAKHMIEGRTACD